MTSAKELAGLWIQEAMVESRNRFASPVTLTKDNRNIWRDEGSPRKDALTFYLVVKPRANGSVGAFLKNPERNPGRVIRGDVPVATSN